MQPKPLSLTGKLREFYDANPAEFLTAEDVAAKFDCTRRQANEALRGLTKAGGPLVGLHVYARRPVVQQEQASA